jgi:FAD/FMN-containing dehydrogenase
MIDRRTLLRGAGATALVVGFGTSGAWVTQAAASGPFDELPRLDGAVHLDVPTRDKYAQDLGRQVTRRPDAVLTPGSARDVQEMVRFCASRRIPVSVRGQGHSTFGQGLGPGLLIDSRSLHTIHRIGRDHAEVDAGVMWRELLDAALPQGLTPPLLTTFVGLSIGGTLSMGGVPANNREGIQADRVRELEVVTGEGALVRCSRQRRSDLFDAVLAGLGQVAVITKAVVDLVPASPSARTYVLFYNDNTTFFRDFRAVTDRGEIDGAYTLFPLVPDGSRVVYALNMMKWFDPAQPPDDTHLLRGLTPARMTVTDGTYRDWACRYDPVVEMWQRDHDWDNLIKPWSDVILPERSVERYVGEVIPTLNADQVGATGTVFLFRTHRSRLTRPMFRIPEPDGSPWVYLFDVLTSSARPGPDQAFTDRMLARNRDYFDRARAVGGTRYPMGSTPFSQEDWALQYGRYWPALRRAKERYDPEGILTPGPGIFPGR